MLVRKPLHVSPLERKLRASVEKFVTQKLNLPKVFISNIVRSTRVMWSKSSIPFLESIEFDYWIVICICHGAWAMGHGHRSKIGLGDECRDAELIGNSSTIEGPISLLEYRTLRPTILRR